MSHDIKQNKAAIPQSGVQMGDVVMGRGEMVLISAQPETKEVSLPATQL